MADDTPKPAPDDFPVSLALALYVTNKPHPAPLLPHDSNDHDWP